MDQKKTISSKVGGGLDEREWISTPSVHPSSPSRQTEVSLCMQGSRSYTGGAGDDDM